MEIEQVFVDVEALAGRLSADVTACADRLDLGAVTAAVATVRAVQHAADVALTALARRSEALRADTGTGPGADVLAGGAVSSRTAAREADRATLLAEAPALDQAYGAGVVAAEHIDVIAATCARLDGSEREALLAEAAALVDDAAGVGPDVFARTVRRRVQGLRSEQDAAECFERQKRTTRLHKGIDRDSGMHWLHAEFDPVTGTAVFDALDRATDRLRRTRDKAGEPVERPHAAAHTLAQLVTHRSGRARVPRAEILVLIDHQTLVDGLHDASVCETTHGLSLPPGEVRRLACDAGIIPVVFGGDSEVLDVGRASRLATKAQRLALRVMHDTCATEGCTVGFDDCDIHHVEPWDPYGQTDLDNLLPLCTRHHHRLHCQEAAHPGRREVRATRRRTPADSGAGARAP